MQISAIFFFSMTFIYLFFLFQQLTELTDTHPSPKTDSIDFFVRPISGSSTLHPLSAGRVRVGSKTNLTRPVDRPTFTNHQKNWECGETPFPKKEERKKEHTHTW